jgi:hypothetical protein
MECGKGLRSLPRIEKKMFMSPPTSTAVSKLPISLPESFADSARWH